MTYQLPRYIAICGHPTAGKSEVQKILAKNYAIQPVDDGGPLRRIAMDYLGLTYDQVHSQEGKKEFVQILGRSWQVREILGELGNRFEAMIGADVMPFMVVSNLSKLGKYSFGSVRRQQGAFYKAHGGVVLGIRSPTAQPSEYEFDKFNEDMVDYWIDNDALSRGLPKEEALKDLERKIHQFVIEYTLAKTAADDAKLPVAA